MLASPRIMIFLGINPLLDPIVEECFLQEILDGVAALTAVPMALA